MKQNLFFVLIAIAILYLIYSFSKNNHKLSSNHNNNKHTTKEHFQVDYGLIDEVGSDILSDPIDITDSPDYWERLNAQLETDNSNLSASNQAIRDELNRIGLLISGISESNGELSTLIAELIKENSALETYIRTTTRCRVDTTGTTQPYGISNCDGIFDPAVMDRYKDSLRNRLKTLETRVNGLLVQDSYDELQLADDGVTGLTAEHISEIITHVQNVKTMYRSFFSSLTYSVADPDTTDWAARTSQIMATAESNCLNKEDTCIYATYNENSNVVGYYTSNMNHVFLPDLWHSEPSCEPDPDSNCHSYGELSSSNCDGREKTCYDLISDDDVNSGHPNNSNEVGQISYNSNSYTYTSEPLPNVEGEWSCELNYPSQANRGHTCKTESDITDEARDNCEGGESLWGVASYACYTNIGTNEVDGYATYSGYEELPSVSYSEITGSNSKVWSNTSNDDGSFGTCTVDGTCRTVAETSNMAACLTQANSNDYTMNYKCYGTSGSNSNISSVGKSNYRKQYQVGSFDNTSNVWTNGTCGEAHSNYRDCRTKADVDAEVDWKTTNNWQCHTYSNGKVNALEHWNKNYEVNTIFSTDSNIGTKSYTDECRKQADAEAQSNCLNTNQYFCWEDQGSSDNILMHFRKSSSDVNKIYTVPTSTRASNYVDQIEFANNCASSNCTSSNDAYDTVREHCEASNVRSTCYKEDTALINGFNDEVSWSIVYDSNSDFGQYSTRVIPNDDHIKCEERVNCDTQIDVCESKSNKCYTQPTYYSLDSNTNFFDMTSKNYQLSTLDSTGNKCVASSDCVTLPYCSYMTVETNNSNQFVWSDIGKNDCSDPSEGKRYRWTLETNSVASASNPASYSNTVDDTNSNHWRPVNSPDTSSNVNCTPVVDMVGNDVQTITREGDENENDILCQCQSNNDEHYALRYYADSFASNSSSNIGYSNLEDLQSSNCESNECRARNYYTAQERLVECTHPDGLASNAQGEPGLGDKYLDITLSNNGLLCYNDDACSNLCLVSGPSTISTQIGDGINDTEIGGDPPQCYSYGSSNQQNRFSYAANGSLLTTTMPTCTDFVGSNCSETLNSNCGQRYDSMDNVPWTDSDVVRSYIPGTTNSNSTYTDTDTYEGNVVRYNGENGSIISSNVVTYNSSCTSSLLANQTPELKKGLFKYVYEDTYSNDGICIPETTTYVKYQVENINPSDNDYGEHSNCPMDCVTEVPTGITADYERNSNHFQGGACPSDISAGSVVPTRTMNYQVTHDAKYGGTCRIPTSTYSCRHVNRPCNPNSWTGAYTCPSCGAAYNYTQTRTAPTGNNLGLGTTGECTTDQLRTSQIVSTACTPAQLKPCCVQDNTNHYRISYTLSNSNGAGQSSSEAAWTAFNETDIINCESSMTKTYTPQGTCTLSSGSHPSSVTKTNSQPCNTPCVGSWSNWTPLPSGCGYSAGSQTRTFTVNEPQVGNIDDHKCINVAKNDSSLTQSDKNQISEDTNSSGPAYTITRIYGASNCPQINPTISLNNIAITSYNDDYRRFEFDIDLNLAGGNTYNSFKLFWNDVELAESSSYYPTIADPFINDLNNKVFFDVRENDVNDKLFNNFNSNQEVTYKLRITYNIPSGTVSIVDSDVIRYSLGLPSVDTVFTVNGTNGLSFGAVSLNFDDSLFDVYITDKEYMYGNGSNWTNWMSNSDLNYNQVIGNGIYGTTQKGKVKVSYKFKLRSIPSDYLSTVHTIESNEYTGTWYIDGSSIIKQALFGVVHEIYPGNESMLFGVEINPDAELFGHKMSDCTFSSYVVSQYGNRDFWAFRNQSLQSLENADSWNAESVIMKYHEIFGAYRDADSGQKWLLSEETQLFGWFVYTVQSYEITIERNGTIIATIDGASAARKKWIYEQDRKDYTINGQKYNFTRLDGWQFLNSDSPEIGDIDDIRKNNRNWHLSYTGPLRND